ncbi:Guanosine-diphosphatase [Marasmius crinis-equi]|uniref:Guanosine-diphosphatase n=1 Tax=Marasmius crinis-equi TaxID=585013 RepID=A0ABR3FBX5_9AGAR
MTTASNPPEEAVTLKIFNIASSAQIVSEGPTVRKSFPSSSSEELKGRPKYCLNLILMYALLRLGYEFGTEKHVTVEKKVEGTELGVGWCLGAIIGMGVSDLRGRGGALSIRFVR